MWRSILRARIFRTLPKRGLKRSIAKYCPEVKQLVSPLPMFCAFTVTLVLFSFVKMRQHAGMLEKKRIKHRSSELRFLRYASYEYRGQVFMSPHNFIESIVEIDPKRRNRCSQINDANLADFRAHTPRVQASDTYFFRHMHSKGIISYTDYLFLFSTLIKNKSKFKIAFDMIDVNANGVIEREEYLFLETIFTKSFKLRQGLPDTTSDDYIDSNLPHIQQHNNIDTLIPTHFFGPNGTEDLTYPDFERFILNLQTEVLELEFTQFSHGGQTISESNFARTLLRYTYLSSEDYDEYIDRVVDRLEATETALGITFNEFKAFDDFLEFLPDVRLATRFYEILGTPITRVEFQQIVKSCTGAVFTKELTETLFALFDFEGNGILELEDFFEIMKDRRTRGFRMDIKADKLLIEFKRCLKKEMTLTRHATHREKH